MYRNHSTVKTFFRVHQNDEQVGVDKNNILLRGCVLKNTASCVAIVVYAGKSTRFITSSFCDFFRGGNGGG